MTVMQSKSCISSGVGIITPHAIATTLRGIMMLTVAIVPSMPLYAGTQGVIYLECKEESGIQKESVNVAFFGKKGLETSHQDIPPRSLAETELRIHKVTLNPEMASGSWRSDTTPNYYPTHISFSEGGYPQSEILKVWREKKSGKTTLFTRISMWSSSTPFPIKKERYLETEATGTCTIVAMPKSNLF
jgi:hypothetical protein